MTFYLFYDIIIIVNEIRKDSFERRKNMLRIKYNFNGKMLIKYFDSVFSGYEFAIQNIANEEDKKYYKECCGETFENIIKKGRSLSLQDNGCHS